MNRPPWAHLFERFQNLIVLIEDLRRKQVAFGHWIARNDQGKLLCPLWHGANATLTGSNTWALLGYDDCRRQVSCDARNFVSGWDKRFITPDYLEEVLVDILRERLEDADAVQDMIGQECVAQ